MGAYDCDCTENLAYKWKQEEERQQDLQPREEKTIVKNCPMWRKNGNCSPTDRPCAESKNICEALQQAYRDGQLSMLYVDFV